MDSFMFAPVGKFEEGEGTRIRFWQYITAKSIAAGIVRGNAGARFSFAVR